MKKIISVIILLIILSFIYFFFVDKKFVLKDFFNTSSFEIKKDLFNEKNKIINVIDEDVKQTESNIDKDTFLEEEKENSFINDSEDEISGYDDKGFCLAGNNGGKWLKVDLYFDTGKKKIIQSNQYVLEKEEFNNKCVNDSSIAYDNPENAKGRYFICKDYLKSKKNCNLK